ncbi:hypothetical protein [Streptomyces sp. NBC_01477]|uniref:hypothetical protein n=1 Tax=Streptomyces sp. NBC_01477 TaxID=2976015 RepID=UPI002E35ABA7|nr:hypothetical protein [Streptomyces sp. NBC_01477]
MPRRIDQLPPDATTLARRLAALEREVRELRASKRASWATIGGGDTTITGARIQTAETGHRVVLDADGALKTYDDDEHQTNYVGGADNRIWNQAGWDPDGTPNGEWVALSTGNIQLGDGDAMSIDDQDQTLTGILGIAGPQSIALTSPAIHGTYANQATAILSAGQTGGQSGTVSAPAVQVIGGADVAVSGALVKLTSAFDIPSWRYVPETWHAPTYNTNWAGGSAAATRYAAMQYRQDAEDNLHVCGTVHCTASGGLAAGSYTFFTLPTAYTPKKLFSGAGIHVGSGDAWKTACRVNVDSNGAVGIATTSAVALNDGFYFNFVVPLGNIA